MCERGRGPEWERALEWEEGFVSCFLEGAGREGSFQRIKEEITQRVRLVWKPEEEKGKGKTLEDPKKNFEDPKKTLEDP